MFCGKNAFSYIKFYCRAPTDCRQYFTGVSGSVMTYNFGLMLGGQRYTNCFRQEQGTVVSTTVYISLDTQTNSFMVSNQIGRRGVILPWSKGFLNLSYISMNLTIDFPLSKAWQQDVAHSWKSRNKMYSWLSRCSEARVSSSGFSLVILTKVMAGKSFLFTESSLVMKLRTLGWFCYLTLFLYHFALMLNAVANCHSQLFEK